MKNRKNSPQVRRNSNKDFWGLLSIGILLSVFAFYFTFKFVAPKPPQNISISSGQIGGEYYSDAKKYSKEFKEHNINLEVHDSNGSRQNIKRLLDHKTDIAIVQGGTIFDNEKVVSLGSLYYEPLLIFYNKDLPIQYLSDLKGYKIAIGKEGSGTQVLSNELLKSNNINSSNSNLLAISSKDAAKGLIDGNIDVAFFVTSVHSETIKPLLFNDKLTLFNFARADAYVQKFPYLTAIKLYEGIISFDNNLPNRDITLIAPTANIVVRDDFNASLSILLLQALKKIHGNHDLFAKPEFFPNYQTTSIPVTDATKRFYNNGPPFLMRYFPFWIASLLDRLIVMIIPIIVLFIPFLKAFPPVYRWRIRSKIYSWYTELQKVDDYIIGKTLNDEEYEAMNKILDKVSTKASKVETPLSYVDQLYNLQVHIELVKKRLLSKKK